MATNKKKVGAAIGAGLAALAATAAGAYFLYGKDGAKNRRKVRGWTLKAKGEVLDQLERSGKWTEKEYNAAVGKVAKQYSKLKHVDKRELAQLAKELRGHWRSIRRQMEAAESKAQKQARKIVRKASPARPKARKTKRARR